MSPASGGRPSVPAIPNASVAPRTTVFYHPDPFDRWGPHVFVAIAGVAVSAGVFTIPDRESAWPVLMVLVFWFLLQVATFKLLGAVRLDLSPAGVRSRGIGTSIEVAWSDVEAALFSGGGRGLVLKAPMTTEMSKLNAALSSLQRDGVYVLGETERKWVAQRRWLSLGKYTRAIRKGDLAAQIDGFAPGLRAGEARAAWLHPAAERSPAQTAVLLKTAATMLCTIGVAIALERWNKDVLNVIMFVVVSFLFFYYAAHAIHVAAVSLWRRDYTTAVVSLALGIPAYMFVYLVGSGIVEGASHHEGGGPPPTARHAPAPADPGSARPPAVGAPPRP